MASLTPLSKGLIALAVVGAVVSAVWNLGLKGRMDRLPFSLPQSGPATQVPPTGQSSPAMPAGAPVAVTPAPTSTPSAASARQPPSIPTEAAERGRKLLDAGDFAGARIHLEQAVKGGDGASACHLGEMTLKGQAGIQANQEKAAELFRLAQSRNIICFAPGR